MIFFLSTFAIDQRVQTARGCLKESLSRATRNGYEVLKLYGVNEELRSLTLSYHAITQAKMRLELSRIGATLVCSFEAIMALRENNPLAMCKLRQAHPA